MNNKICFIIFFLNSFFSWTQEKSIVLQQRLEYWMEKNQQENSDLTQIQEVWEYYLENPLNINKATKDELIQLDLLNELQINELLLHRERLGDFLTIYELQTLNSWDAAFIQLIMPFITINNRSENPPLSWSELIHKGKIEGVTRYQHSLQKSIGYMNVPDSIKMNSNSYYWGNSDYYLTKIRYNYLQRVSIGLTAEKDAGEPFFQNVNKKGFDFYSFHLNLKGGKYLKNVLVGDYHIQIGQGLNCWTSFALGKSLELTTCKKNAQVIRPHTSTDENRFFRGVALDFSYKRFTLLFFASNNKKDASLSMDSIGQVMSVLTTGYHRTKSEIARKDQLTEKIIGTYLRYDIGTLHVGVATIFTHFSSVLNKNSTPYNVYDFRGQQYQSSSVDYSYAFKNMLLFGELSYVDFSRKTAFLHGILFALDQKTSLSLVYRNYDKGYETIYNAGFSEGNSVQNEKGIYVGITIKPNQQWTIQGYSDFFRYPWLKYQVNLPSKGMENVVQVTYKPSKTIECYLRYRGQNTEQNSLLASQEIDDLVSVFQQNIRLDLNYKMNENWALRSRIEGVTLTRKDRAYESGILIFQDINYVFKSIPLEYVFRFVLFDTDSYATRIYGYEANPLYQYSCPAFFGKGSRTYLLIRYTFFKRMDCWLKIGTSNYPDLKTLGSGTDQIIGNQKREINLQFRWRL